MTRIRRSPLLAGLLLAPFAMAQDAETRDLLQAAPEKPQVEQPADQPPVVFRQVAPQPTPLPSFESLVVRGAENKVIRLEGHLDLIAMNRNVLIDDATRQRIRPILNEWLADLDQLVIDNLDFLEALEPPDGSPGALTKIDLNDQTTIQPVAVMMNQLISAGPLTQHLQTRGALTREQAELNQRIINDYQQHVMNEVLAENQVVPGQEPQDGAHRNRQVNVVSQHLYGLSARDAMTSYHRQLSAAAPFAEQIVSVTELAPETTAQLEPYVAAARNAPTDLDRRRTVRTLLNHLTFDERREFLQRAMEVVPRPELLGQPTKN
jgi:hypothetical protein